MMKSEADPKIEAMLDILNERADLAKALHGEYVKLFTALQSIDLSRSIVSPAVKLIVLDKCNPEDVAKMTELFDLIAKTETPSDATAEFVKLTALDKLSASADKIKLEITASDAVVLATRDTLVATATIEQAEAMKLNIEGMADAVRYEPLISFLEGGAENVKAFMTRLTLNSKDEALKLMAERHPTSVNVIGQQDNSTQTDFGGVQGAHNVTATGDIKETNQ